MHNSIFDPDFGTHIDQATRYSHITERRRVPFWLNLLTAVITLFILFILLTPHYRVIEENGSYYVTVSNLFQSFHAPRSLWETNPAVSPLYFHSLEEMRSDFLNNDFSEDEINSIGKLVAYFDQGRIQIPNLNNLCQPVLPNDITWSGGIKWRSGAGYSFCIDSQTSYISFEVKSSEYFQENSAKYLNFTAGHRERILYQALISDRNAMQYHVQSRLYNTEVKFLVYTLTQGSKTIVVYEHFKEIDDELSSYMRLYIQDGNHYGSVTIKNYATRPSVDYLLSFGLTPLE